MNISYDRTFLITTLEKAKLKIVEKHVKDQEKLKIFAIKQLESEIKAIKTGRGPVNIYIRNVGTYYLPDRGPDTRTLDNILKQLKLGDSKKIRLGQYDSEFVLRFIN